MASPFSYILDLLGVKKLYVSGSAQTYRNGLDLVAGSGVTLTPADDAAADTMRVTVAASGGSALPSPTGNALEILRVNGDESGYETVTAQEMLASTSGGMNVSLESSGQSGTISKLPGLEAYPYFRVMSVGSVATFSGSIWFQTAAALSGQFYIQLDSGDSTKTLANGVWSGTFLDGGVTKVISGPIENAGPGKMLLNGGNNGYLAVPSGVYIRIAATGTFAV